MERPEEEFIKDLFTVIVLYKLKVKESKTIQAIINAVRLHKGNTNPRILLYDNSPDALEVSGLEECCQIFELTYIHDKTNPGVSKAYNVAAKMAASEGKSWLLFFDQDTIVSDSLYAAYFLSGVAKYPDVHLFCPFLMAGNIIYSPCKYYFKRGFLWKNIKKGKHNLKSKSLLNSGILIKRLAFEKTGGFNEKINLYFSDFEFIDRYRTHYSEFCVIDGLFLHELSDNVFGESEKAISRFYFYSAGARESVKSGIDWLLFFTTVGLRSIRLSFRFRRSNFVKVFLKVFIFNKK